MKLSMQTPLAEIDEQPEVRAKLLPLCRSSWRHVDRFQYPDTQWHALMQRRFSVVFPHGPQACSLAIQDPPYNLVAFETRSVRDYIAWARCWVRTRWEPLRRTVRSTFGSERTSETIQPPEFMILMREFPIQARSFITCGTKGIWNPEELDGRTQELLYYVRGNPAFNIEAEYTDS